MPPDHDPGPVAAFCADLKELRRACGRDLAGICREINLSRAQLYAVLNGEVKRPPDFTRLVEPFVRACGAGDPAVAEWRRRHDVLVRVYDELRRRSRAEPLPVPVTPAQLPPATAAFSGRSAELARLDDLLPRSPGAAVVISAVSGTAGVGKTALAVHWAHRVAHRFGDGQLYVNLRGFGPDGRVTDPADALHGFLEALGATRIPADLDARIALYRSMIAGRRILVLLDNARDADQVRPLLPGSPSALVLVTSRNQLTSLAAADGARLLMLDVLADSEARELLRRRLGAARTAAEPAAVERIVTACARLPLALNIAAARAEETGFPLAAIADELAGARLDALDAGGPASDVRAVFSWSYTALTAPAARLFRLLGLHPGPEVSAAAAHSIAGAPVRRELTELTRATLLTELSPGRFSFHDLLRDYAASFTDDDRDAATIRMVDHYTHCAHAADRLLHPSYPPYLIPAGEPAPGVHVQTFETPEAADGWLNAETEVLVALVSRAPDRQAWQLARALNMHLNNRALSEAREAVWLVAAQAAHRLGDARAESYAWQILSHVRLQLGRAADAHADILRGLELIRRTDDRANEAHALGRLAQVLDWQGRHAEAADAARAAYAVHEMIDDRPGMADALNQIAWNEALLGRYEEAAGMCNRALVMLAGLNDTWSEAMTVDTLAYAHRHLGRHAEAAQCYSQAAAKFREVGDRYYEATTLDRFGDARLAAGAVAEARALWVKAARMLTELGHYKADEVRAKLGGADRSAA